MSHIQFLEINVKHSYYSNGLCNDFSITPDGDTERRLRNHRCVIKAKANGINIYIETDSDGKPKIAFEKKVTLSFDLHLKNIDFPLFSHLAILSDGSNYKITYPSQIKDKFFAKIDIQYDFNQAEKSSVEIAFSAKSVFWFYYLITDQSNADTSFVIAAQNATGITWKKLDGTDNCISRKLAGQYPGIRQLIFASEQSIPCRESGLQHIQLLLEGSTIIENLPNPSWRNHFQTTVATTHQTVDAIFQVIRYLTTLH